MLISCAGWAQDRLAAADIGAITFLFFFLVLLAATQDIAVDGWALTLLSRQHIEYALGRSNIPLPLDGAFSLAVVTDLVSEHCEAPQSSCIFCAQSSSLE